MAKHWTPGDPRLTPRERAFYGVTATVVHVETGKQRSLVFSGTTMEAVEKLIAWCDTHGPQWKVRTISNPVSIHGDLRNNGNRRRAKGNYTEAVMLGKAGRTDLIERLRLDGRRAADIRENEKRLGRRKR